MEYYLLRNLGYDGTAIRVFKFKEKAIKAYQVELEESHNDKLRRGDDADTGVILIEGTSIIEEDRENIFPYEEK